MDKFDYYRVLGITRQATATEVKQAYRQLAKRFHPDRWKGDREVAEESFRLVSEAYEVLINEDKRRVYDAYGHKGIEIIFGIGSIVYMVKKIVLTQQTDGKLNFSAVAERRETDTGNVSTVRAYGVIEAESYVGADGKRRILLVAARLLTGTGSIYDLWNGDETKWFYVNIVHEEDDVDWAPESDDDDEKFNLKVSRPPSSEEIEEGKRSIMNFFRGKITNAEILCGPNICPDCRSVVKMGASLKCATSVCNFERRPPDEQISEGAPEPFPAAGATPPIVEQQRAETTVKLEVVRLNIKGNVIEFTVEELGELILYLDELLKET